MLAILILTFGIISRLIVHAPNFTPVIALCLFSGAYLNKKYAVVLPVALMIISDIIIGFHPTIPFTWASVALISFLGLWLRDRKNFLTIIGTALVSSILFFIITNFGAWLTIAEYPKTWGGLIQCYTMAIPFFRTMLASSVIYAVLLFGIYEFIAARIKNTRLAPVLLKS